MQSRRASLAPAGLAKEASNHKGINPKKSLVFCHAMELDQIETNSRQGWEGFPVSFEIKSCQILYFGPHKSVPGRVVEAVRVRICEIFMSNVTTYSLDLKVKADVGSVSSEAVQRALLAHAARQLNKLKARHQPILAAE